MPERKVKKQQSATINTTGGAVRITTPEGSRRRRRSTTDVVVDVVTPNGFIDFLREHAIVGLAVGFAIGTQAQTVVKQLIASFIDPLFKLLFPGDKVLSQRTYTWHFDGRSANFGWGAVVYTLIDFIFVLFVIYIIIKLFNLDKLDRPKG